MLPTQFCERIAIEAPVCGVGDGAEQAVGDGPGFGGEPLLRWAASRQRAARVSRSASSLSWVQSRRSALRFRRTVVATDGR